MKGCVLSGCWFILLRLGLGVQFENVCLPAICAQEPLARAVALREVYMLVKSLGSRTPGNGFADHALQRSYYLDD